jgi:hypothetical protein
MRRLFKQTNLRERGFTRSLCEHLPFADGSFDVVCARRLAVYGSTADDCGNRQSSATGRSFSVKNSRAAFYLGMIRQRWKSFSPKQIAYPLICLAGGTWHLLTGKQLRDGFWKGKEVYQTRGFLEREFEKNNLRIVGFLSDTNVENAFVRHQKS